MSFDPNKFIMMIYHYLTFWKCHGRCNQIRNTLILIYIKKYLLFICCLYRTFDSVLDPFTKNLISDVPIFVVEELRIDHGLFLVESMHFTKFNY